MRSIALVATVLLTTACGQKAAEKTEAPKKADAAAKVEKADPPAEKPGAPAPAGQADASPVIDHVVQNIDGKEVKLSEYRGKALLIVNTASECGNTPQYEGLQKLHEKYGDKGLAVLGFPSNDFGEQEPGSHEEIKKFVDEKFGVTFPMFAKVKTKGEGQAPLYKTLTEYPAEQIAGEVEWNFVKFLVGPDGKVVARFHNKVAPDSEEVVEAIESVLPAAGGAG